MPLMKAYRPWDPDAVFLLPPSPREWLREDDLAYFILDLVSTLDLTAIEAIYQAKERRGTVPYDPWLLAALLLYGYCTGVRSSRKIEAATYRDIAFRVIAGDHHPDHTVISEFRRLHLGALKGVFLQTVKLAQKAGLVQLGRVALDGTKVKANASKHKAMSYERMLKAEAELVTEIEQMLAEAERIDQEEDKQYGRGRRGDELPAELKRREDRLRKIREAKAALEAEAARTREETLRAQADRQREQAEQAEDPTERKRAASRAAKAEAEADKLRGVGPGEPPPPSSPAQDLPHHRVPATPDGKPEPKAQRNFTDPDSRIMKKDGAFEQAFNCQAVAEASHQIIVACEATNQAPDVEHLPALVEQTRDNCDAYPGELLADAGYFQVEHVGFCEQRGIESYVPPERLKHGEKLPPLEEPPEGLDAKGRMRQKLRTQKGRETYARRKVIIEPVFGQMTEVQSFRRFLLRGLDKIRGEWALVCAGHNLRKMFLAGVAVAG
jgi:transposase